MVDSSRKRVAVVGATGVAGQSVFVMAPEKWRTVDYRKSAAS